MTKVILSQGEINTFGRSIYSVLKDVPLFFLNEVMEIAMEDRRRDGEDEDLDISSSEDEEEEEEEEEEEKESSDEESGSDSD